MSPYTQEIKDDYILRTFDENTDSHELVWHRDRKDREVTVVEGNGWKFQMDDELPSELHRGDVITIPKETFHRVIRGSGKLVIQIRE